MPQDQDSYDGTNGNPYRARRARHAQAGGDPDATQVVASGQGSRPRRVDAERPARHVAAARASAGQAAKPGDTAAMPVMHEAQQQAEAEAATRRAARQAPGYVPAGAVSRGGYGSAQQAYRSPVQGQAGYGQTGYPQAGQGAGYGARQNAAGPAYGQPMPGAPRPGYPGYGQPAYGSQDYRGPAGPQQPYDATSRYPRGYRPPEAYAPQGYPYGSQAASGGQSYAQAPAAGYSDGYADGGYAPPREVKPVGHGRHLAARAILAVLSWVFRLAAIGISAVVVLDSLQVSAVRTELMRVTAAIAAALPSGLAGLYVIDTPFGGAFRGDFAIAAVVLFVFDWILCRIRVRLR